MSALPIIARELRVRARKPWTAWARVVVGLIVSFVAVATISQANLAAAAPTPGPWRPGKDLFDALSALAFLFCLVEGVRQTADSISQEKREGTFGLLLLTDLTGLDVVLGKLAATSLGTFYLLLAVFPAMAVSLTLGGVTAGEFWRTQLVLLNTLFLAVAVGICSSAGHREGGRALLQSFLLIGVLLVIPLGSEWGLRQLGLPSLSPWMSLRLADDARYTLQPHRFWLTLLAVHALGWMLLVLTGRRVQLDWRDEPPLPPVAHGEKPPILAALPAAAGAAPAATLRVPDDDPAGWLAARAPAPGQLLWASIIMLAIGPLALMLPRVLNLSVATGALAFTLGWGTTVLSLLLLAMLAAGPLAAARRDGSMELLLPTLLTPAEIVRGQWRALWRNAEPLILIAMILIVVLALVFWLSVDTEGAFWLGLPYLVCSGADRLGRGVAVLWLGLYLGLRASSQLRAIGQNLVWTFAVPWMVNLSCTLATDHWLAGQRSSVSAWTGFFLQLLPNFVSGAYSLLLIVWTQQRIVSRFRELAAR